jgi:signal transduction histidine kinase
VTVDAEVDPAVGGLDTIQRLAVLRVVQEGLANVVKHAGAARAWLELRRDGDGVALVVRDDGAGGAGLRHGGGLAGLADRLAALGGRLDLAPADPGGTSVTATLPMAIGD